jgi:ArsR family transcriptional regulator
MEDGLHMNERERLQKLFLCLSDITRLRIIEMLAGRECSVGEFVDGLNEPQPKVSRHLATMRDDGIVSTRRDGKHIYYALNRNVSEPVINAVLFELDGNSRMNNSDHAKNIYNVADISEEAGTNDVVDASDLPVYLL